MSLLMRPGSTLLLLALVAFVVSFFIRGVPVVGGLLYLFLLAVTVFGVIGGIWLLIMGRRADDMS